MFNPHYNLISFYLLLSNLSIASANLIVMLTIFRFGVYLSSILSFFSPNHLPNKWAVLLQHFLANFLYCVYLLTILKCPNAGTNTRSGLRVFFFFAYTFFSFYCLNYYKNFLLYFWTSYSNNWLYTIEVLLHQLFTS